MLKQERILLMEELIERKGVVSMEELCQTFSISMNTARSDVREIVNSGRAQKTYGGVSYTQPAQYTSYSTREMEHTAKKHAIARAAAALVNDSDIIYIDVGTTCLPIIDYIPEEHFITIITMDLAAISQAAQRPNTKLMTFGGTYQPKSNSFKCTYPAMHSYVDTCNITKVFLGTTGVSPSGAMTNSENFGREIRSRLIKSCPECYLLADSSKFGKAALLTYGTLTDLAACITDADIPEKYRELCHNLNVKLIIPNQSK